jgi:hypothetical protein
MTKKIILKCNGKKLEFTPLASGLNEVTSPSIAEVHAPGQGSYEISVPTLSADVIYEGETVSCKVAIKGKNIAQINSELMIQVGHFKVGPLMTSFLPAPKNREIKGMVHPHWASENEIAFELKPAGRLLYCGEGFTMACMTPERYAVEPDAQIWSLEGIYQRGGGEPFRVKLEFNSQGNLVRKTGFYPESVEGLTSPFELLIEDGDTFEPYVTMINDKGEIGVGTVNPIMLGGGNQLHWQQIDACPGNYHVGVVVEDFDGNKTRVFTTLSILDPK